MGISRAWRLYFRCLKMSEKGKGKGRNMSNLKKQFGIDPVIAMMVAAVLAVAGLFALATYSIGNMMKGSKPATTVPAKRPLGLRMHIDHIKGGQKAASNKTGNQLADGSVTGTVFIGDFKITGLEDVTKKR